MGQKNSCKKSIKSDELPLIPNKLYFAIGEVAKLCSLEPHVLRYWEQEFSVLSPLKRRGNRRYYQRKDVLVVRRIRALLYDQGFTIDGARKQLVVDKQADQSVKKEVTVKSDQWLNELQGILCELEEA